MRIVVVNAHWNNRGDEAAHRALWRALLARYPRASLTILFKDRKPITWFPDDVDATFHSAQFDASPWEIWLAVLTAGIVGRSPELRKTIATMRHADLIVYSPGGSVISDRFFWRKQMEYLAPFLAARLYGIPIFVAAPSMGPFEPAPTRTLRRWLLRGPKVLCVREDISRQYLTTIGVKDNVEVSMDLAFLDEVDVGSAEQQLDAWPDLRTFLGAYDRVVGLTISDFRWHVKLGKDAELSSRIADAFRQMIQALVVRGYGVVLIPQLFGNQNDVEYLRSFAGEGVHVMSEQADTYAQQHVISMLYAVIGMRYHSNIFAAKAGTPFVAITYEEKMAGFLALAGLAEYGISLEELSLEVLDDRFRALEANHEAFIAQLQGGLPEWRRRARKAVELLPDLS